MKPSHAHSAPRIPARTIPMLMPVWLLAGPGRNLAECDDVGVSRLVEPAPPLDKLDAEIPEMRNRPTKRRQP